MPRHEALLPAAEMAFDDDDNPSGDAAQPAAAEDAPTAEEALEDGVPDYQLFASGLDKRGVSGKAIRKGEKDFEPHGTRAQDRALELSRRALEDVVGYARTHRAEAWIRGWYLADGWAARRGDGGHDGWLRDRVVVVEHEKGSWMKDMGRTVAGGADQPGAGRLWLLPEEALYLVERGTLDLWWPDLPLQALLPRGGHAAAKAAGPDDYDAGLPLSLEAAYALLIGADGEPGKTSLPKHQVFTHLKRAGYHVLRAPADGDSDGDSDSSDSSSSASSPPRQSLWLWLFSLVGRERRPRQSPFGPLVSPGLYRAYGPIYQRLALVPRHRPSAAPRRRRAAEEPFRVHYHVWKPGRAPFSKKKPPPPDFRIAVADAGESCPPTLEQMSALLESTPLAPPGEAMQGPGRLYQRLKHGYRSVLVAVVDRGLVNFVRFGEAAFGEERLFERFDAKGGGGRGGKRSGRGRGRGRGRGGRGLLFTGS